MNRAAAIEKNRLALLGMVSGWLFLASLFFIKHKNKQLPRRLGAYIAETLAKAEAAARFLQLACLQNLSSADQRYAFQHIVHINAQQAKRNQSITFALVIERLKALRYTLTHLQVCAEKLRLSFAGRSEGNASIGLAFQKFCNTPATPIEVFGLPATIDKHADPPWLPNFISNLQVANHPFATTLSRVLVTEINRPSANAAS
ncbi:MAG: hypothetical protein U5K75_06975 [Ahrensia sp.]|nr:hypothetical protein [Ahrensia sp.]